MTEVDETELELEAPETLIGRVAIVGAPNVGKSTLINRLIGKRDAIISPTPGVTRDRHDVTCEWNGRHFLLTDTGGVGISDNDPLMREVIAQVEAAIAASDLVLFVVDAQLGVSGLDETIAEIIRRSRKPYELIANKVDGINRMELTYGLYELGMGDPIAVSAAQGMNSGDLLDRIVERLEAEGTSLVGTPGDAMHLGVFGRRNVGKSTLVNRLLGADRVIVSDIAGTTRDAVDTQITVEDRPVVLVDTAGIQRARKSKDDLQYYSEVRALQAADRAHVAILVIDASEGVTDTDLQIAERLRTRNCAILVALNKWDIGNTDLGDAQERIGRKLRQRPETITLSGLTGRNVHKLMDKAFDLYDRSSQRVPTPVLNKFMRSLLEATPPPSDSRGKRLKVKYAAQYDILPPRIRVMVNSRSLVVRSYAYFLENRLRDEFGFEGCPLIIEYQSK